MSPPANAPTPVRFADETDPVAACPCCGHRGLRLFYEVVGVPSMSNRLVHTARAAKAFPTADVRLGECDACGFVTNTRFDPSLILPDAYEATQACSATFARFADALAADWVRRFQLQGRRVLEVGSGDGDFLRRLLRAGVAQAIGYDPATPTDAVATPGLTLERRRFDDASPTAGTLGVDAVICRHTLEHIPDVSDFLCRLRRRLADRPDAVVLFEVPDAERVFELGAFYDVFHEHCSYFTADSLRHAFGVAGFDVTNVRRVYDGQYLVLEARPISLGRRPDVPRVACPPTPYGGVARLSRRWRNAAGEKVTKWSLFFAEARARSRRVALWGAGSKAAGFLATLGVRDAVACVVDINPAKAGSFMAVTAQPVVTPDALPTFAPDVVIVMNPVYRQEIGSDLRRHGVTCDVTALA